MNAALSVEGVISSLVSWGSWNDSLLCRVDISAHCDVSADGTRDKTSSAAAVVCNHFALITCTHTTHLDDGK